MRLISGGLDSSAIAGVVAVVPFCDPVGWVEIYGPVVGPILAALSVVFYPVALIYQSLLLASQLGQIQIQLGSGFGGAIAQVLLVLFLIVVILILIAVIVGVLFLGGVFALFALVLRRLFEPAPINDAWEPRRRTGRGTQVG